MVYLPTGSIYPPNTTLAESTNSPNSAKLSDILYTLVTPTAENDRNVAGRRPSGFGSTDTTDQFGEYMRQEGPEGRVRFVCDGDMLLKLDREMRQCLVNIDADVSVDLHLEILRALGEHERLVEVENMAYKDSHLGAFRHFLPSLSNTLCQRGELYVNEETKERAAGSHWGDGKKIGRTILDSINWVGGEARVGGEIKREEVWPGTEISFLHSAGSERGGFTLEVRDGRLFSPPLDGHENNKKICSQVRPNNLF